MRLLNWHTASGAETPHVVVYIEEWDAAANHGEQIDVVATFYPLDGEYVEEAEKRALDYIMHKCGPALISAGIIEENCAT